MRIIGQGLRRSGTSIFFRLISQDSRFVTYSEPLAKDKLLDGNAIDKGTDHMKGIRSSRNEFLKIKNIESLEFNHGAPTNFELELVENSLDNNLLDYIQFLLDKGENTFLKFVRCGFSIKQLSEIGDDVLLIHIEKNPALWAMSHIFGRNYTDYEKSADWFFEKREKFNSWSQETIANFYIAQRNPEFLERPAYFKLLYIWRDFNLKMKQDGGEYFKNRFLSIENSVLHENYSSVLEEIYSHGEISVPDSMLKWADSVLRPPRDIVHKTDQRWASAFEELGIDLRYLS